MGYDCKILADSINPRGHRLVTMTVTYPRFVHAELLTHRSFSRNSSSSRAIPIEKVLQRVIDEPAGPVWWGKNQKGMQAAEELAGVERFDGERLWWEGRKHAVATAQQLQVAGLHKQIVNRVVEPWMWITVIVTATEWANFFALRCHPDAQPEIRKAAEMMRECYAGSNPAELKYDSATRPDGALSGSWHLPLVGIDADDATSCMARATLDHGADHDPIVLAKISAGRCARVSYLTHEGIRDPDTDVGMADRLMSNGHTSPLEHPATPFSPDEWAFRTELQARVTADGLHSRYGSDRVCYRGDDWVRAKQAIVGGLEFNGNVRGWTQLRKLVANEAVFGG